MLKRVFGLLFVLVLLVSAGFAIIRGIDSGNQSLIKIGESITISEGAEVKTAVSVGGNVTVYGSVLQDVVAVGGSVFLKDTAMVGGDVVAVGGRVMKEPGAITKGDIVEVAVEGFGPAVAFFTKGGILKGLAFFGLLSFIGFIVLTIILVALFTPQLGRVSSAIEGNLTNCFLAGLLIVLLFVPVGFLLFISIIGIILIPAWVILVAAAALFGYLAASHLLGKKTLHVFKIVGQSMMVETLVGVVLLALVGLFPIVGHLIKLIAVLCGLGGVYWTCFGTR